MTEEPTPVDEDVTATAGELIARARSDFKSSQNRRDQVSREDRTGLGTRWGQ